MIFAFVVIVGILVVPVLNIYLKKLHTKKKLKHVPSLQNELPIIGHGHWFLFKNTKQIMDVLIKAGGDQETPSMCWFGPYLTIIVNKPDDMKAILMSPNCLQKPYVYNFFGSTRSLFNSPVHIWKKDRKFINPTFNSRILNSFVPIFNEKAEVLVKRLESKLDSNQAFDIGKMMFACTLEMICSTTLGHDIHVQSDKNQAFRKSLELYEQTITYVANPREIIKKDQYRTASEFIARRIMKVWLQPECLYRLSSNYKREQSHFAMLTGYPKDIRKIKEREFNESYAVNKKIQDHEVEYSTPQIFVNEMLKLYKQERVSLEFLDDQILGIIVGVNNGNETTSLTISNVILMLAIHKDIQDRVYNELNEIYESTTTPSSTESISKLEYMEKVIKETMRLYPVAPFLGRECQADTKLSTCTIPAGTLIMLDFHHLHRNEGTWGPNSHKFNPENFTPEKIAKIHPYSYLPFSGGPRNCVGIKYAWISMKIVLASLVRRYRFSTKIKYENITLKWDSSLKIVGGHQIKLEKRDSKF